MKIPPRGKLYSLNEGYEASWDESTKEYVRSKKYPEVSLSTGKHSRLGAYQDKYFFFFFIHEDVLSWL